MNFEATKPRIFNAVAVGEIHLTDALSWGSIPPLPLCGFSPPRGEKTSLILWDRQHKTVLSGFMGISSVGYAATFPSGEGFYSPLRCERIPASRFDREAVGEMHHTDAPPPKRNTFTLAAYGLICVIAM